jgi:hypothetical protein
MENAETILVIILSVFLAISLVLSIILLVKFIQITNQIKRLTEKAERLVDTAESVGEFFHKASGSFAVGKVISNIVSTVMNNKRGKDKHGKE